MSRNLIVYKVEYNLKQMAKRIVMTGWRRNHRNVENKFFKQMEGLEDTTYSGNKYRIKSVRKA
jgi:hypothetical protein